VLAAPVALFGAKPGALRVGSQTNAWTIDPKNFESLMRVLATIKELGFDGFETGFVNVRSEFHRPDQAFDRIKKSGLKFLGIHVFLTSYEPETAIAKYELLTEVADGGAALGAERLIVSGASTVHPLAIRGKAEALNRVAKYCKKAGIGCAYHNHAAEFAQGGAQIEGLLSQTDPGVHFVLDAGHAIEGGAHLAEFFAKNWRRIDAIHLRDAKGGNEVPLGQGDYDYAPLAKEINATGWRGWLVTEEERLSGEKPGEEAVRPAREAIRKVFGV
jgi:inosose dehydratase